MPLEFDPASALAAITGAADDAVVFANLEGTITAWNQGAERLLGFKAEESVGRPLRGIVASTRGTEYDHLFDRALGGERVRHEGVQAAHRSRGEITVAVTLAPVSAPDGALEGVVLLARDVLHGSRAEHDAYRLSAIVRWSDDAIVGKDLNGIITSWNVAAERMFGYTAEEVIGKSITILIPPDRLAEEEYVLGCVRRGQILDHFETVRRAKDGHLLDISLTVSPIRTPEGAIIGVSKIARDVTEQRRAANRLRDEKRVVETLNRIGVLLAGTLDDERIIETVTEAATSLTSASMGTFFHNGPNGPLSRSVVAGSEEEAFVECVRAQAAMMFDRAADAMQSLRIDDVSTDPRARQMAADERPSALPFCVRSYLAVPVRGASGMLLGGLFLAHPTPAMFGERHERLVVGIAGWGGLALENARLYQEARQANRTKDEFLATLSHELRTPLNAIAGWAHVLASTSLDDHSRARAVGVIQRNARLQGQLIEDLLDVSRIVAQKLVLRQDPVDLAPVVVAAIDDARPAAVAKGLHLQAAIRAEGVIVKGDAGRLQQVVGNLLSNAVKFTPADGRIDVQLRHVDGQAQVTVSDTGNGIEPQFMAAVFDRFRQVDSSQTRRHGGLGLGLAIVRHLVEAHGGTVSVSSPGAGQGTTFVVWLPVREMEDAAVFGRVTPLDGRSTLLDGVRALVVDDDPDSASVAAAVLEECGAEVALASSAGEALRTMADQTFNVLLADIAMPDMTGYQLIRAVRVSSAEHRTLPAIAVTAYAGEQNRQDAIAAGFDGHLSKPIDPVSLTALVKELIDRGVHRSSA